MMCGRRWPGIIFPRPRAQLQSYRGHQGTTPDYVEALSWMARASLQSNQLDRAQTYARQTESLSRQLLANRPLDAEPQLPTALGAAIEVQARVLAAAESLPRRSLCSDTACWPTRTPPSRRDCKRTSIFWHSRDGLPLL